VHVIARSQQHFGVCTAGTTQGGSTTSLVQYLVCTAETTKGGSTTSLVQHLVCTAGTTQGGGTTSTPQLVASSAPCLMTAGGHRCVHMSAFVREAQRKEMLDA
jgi:hypothetical protein